MTSQDYVARAELLPLLGVVKKSGSDILAFCPVPAHNDGAKHGGKSGQSLILHASGVLECKGGCAFGDVLKALRARAPEQHQNGRSSHVAPRETLGELVTAYDYRDPHTGVLIAVKGRFEKPSPDGGKADKSFRWRMPEGDYNHGIKDGGLSVATMPLWGAEGLAGVTGRVWVAEGESATTAIRAHGELAVCGAWGASQRDFGDAFEVLRGRDVVLWPDNDVSGREYMAEVRRHLRGIAATIAVVSAPVPPKGDAVEYFAGGGSVGDLLADVLPKDAVEFMADDGLRVRLATDAGEITFDVMELTEDRHDLNCDLTVVWRNPQAEHPYSQRINLLSASACEGLVRILGKHFREVDGVNWTTLVQRVLAHVRTALRDMDTSESIEPDPDARPADFVLRGYVVEGGGTILFGAPKRGKSQAALAMAVTIDAGLSGGVFTASRARPVLYVNLERSRGSMLARLTRVNAAVGADMRRPLRFIHARGSGLSGILPRIRKAVRAHGIEVLVLDSISRGGFGDLNANAVANAAIDALNSLGVSWIAIGHSPRPREDDNGAPHLYGSVHQDAGADVLVALQSKPRGTSLLVTLTVTDANDFERPAPLDIVYEFDDDGLIAIRRPIADESADMEDTKILTVRQQILACIRDEGPQTSGEIATRLGKKQPHVSRDLGVLSRDGTVTRGVGGVWALSAEVYQNSYHGNYLGNLPITTLPPQPPPLRGGDGNGKGGSDLDEIKGTCFGCKREGIALAGFDPTSTEDDERALCAACADDRLTSGHGA